jgi:hypothetical protein
MKQNQYFSTEKKWKPIDSTQVPSDMVESLGNLTGQEIGEAVEVLSGSGELCSSPHIRLTKKGKRVTVGFRGVSITESNSRAGMFLCGMRVMVKIAEIERNNKLLSDMEKRYR